MAGITPPNILNEYCAKKNIPAPKYEFIDLTEESTEAYACQLTALNTSVVGVGRSKQEAKHDATKLLIKEVERYFPDINNVPVSIKSSCNSTGTSYTQAKQLPSQKLKNVLQSIKADKNVHVHTIEESFSNQKQNERNQFQLHRDLTEKETQLVTDATTLADRHLYFSKYNAITKLEAEKILNSKDFLNNKEKVMKLLETLGIKTKTKYEVYGNEQVMVIELLITSIDVLFMNTVDEIYDEMVDYFKDMLK